MCVLGLRSRAHKLVQKGIRPATHKSYTSAQHKYVDFCALYQLTPIPVESYNVLLYVTHLYEQGLSASTINVYLSAVRSMHVMSGLPEPLVRSPQVLLALRAIKAASKPVRQKEPITLKLLSRMLVSTTQSVCSGRRC